MRRAIDVVAATAGLLLLGALWAVLAAVILVAMGRPVHFHQQRVGLGGREFSILKLRTMRGERFPHEPDADRLTGVGRLLRAASLDELPQLLNVLRGDMSLIGPRPTLPEQVAHYAPRQHGRHAVRPGITGWAQVNGRNALSWPERIELDLWYVQNRSLALDLRILATTMRQLVRPSGVYGEGGVNQGFPVPATEDGTRDA